MQIGSTVYRYAPRRQRDQGAGRQIPCTRRAKDERSGSASEREIFPATAMTHPPSEVIHTLPEGICAPDRAAFTSRYPGSSRAKRAFRPEPPSAAGGRNRYWPEEEEVENFTSKPGARHS